MPMAIRPLLKPFLKMAPPRRLPPIITIIMCAAVGGICFYLGCMVGVHTGLNQGAEICMRDMELLKSDRDRLNRGMLCRVVL